MPPGYVTEASVRARYKSQVRQAARSKQAKHDLTWDEMLENGYVVIGSPDTVREQLEEAARELRIGHLCAMLQFGNMSDELTRYNSKLFGEKVAPGLRTLFSEYPDPWWPRECPMKRARLPMTKRLVYLPGMAGPPRELSPAMRAVGGRDGWEIVVPAVPGFDGVAGFVAPDDYLDWLTTFWDALDATGALPCPVIGASVGGMIAAELAALASRGGHRRSALLAPFGIGDGDDPGFDLYARPAGERMSPPVRQGRARCLHQALRRPRSRGGTGRPLPVRRRRRQPGVAAR